MPKDLSIRKILLLGSGPIVIGQACEFDYSGTQALRALKAEGYEVLLVNSNPATIMTDPDLSDKVYIEPLTVEFVEKIIEKEKPDALIPTMGGQTALNLTVELAEKGILKKHCVRLLGANLASIQKAEDRDLFKKTMIELGIDIPKSHLIKSLDEGKKALTEIGLPLILRPSFTLGGEGGGVAQDEASFYEILKRGLDLSPVGSVLVEESLIGWKEYELEVVRDCKDNVIIICSIENVDPMGVHTGDSITVAPAQTLSDKQYQHLRDLSKKIIRAIGVDTGGSNIQFAVKPSGADAGRTIVIEMNPRVSRSSALASKATGFPIAKVAAKLAVGYTLDELRNEITQNTTSAFEPTIDYVVTKIPRFDFEKFLGKSAPDATLGTQMKSVGEVMALGKTFKESLLKAMGSLENKWTYFWNTTAIDQIKNLNVKNFEEQTLKRLEKPYWTRFWEAASALRLGIDLASVQKATQFDPWFLEQIQEILDFESYLKTKNLQNISFRELLLAKKIGFSDHVLSRFWEVSENAVQKKREELQILPSYLQVDTCAGEFEAKTPYLYSSYGESSPPLAPTKKSVLIVGSGPNRIGQGIEFDYCCVHAALAAKEIGFESIMVNCNPETVSTDYDISTRLYFEPLRKEQIDDIRKNEPGLIGSIVQFGGQTPLKLSREILASDFKILGTSVESIHLAEDRKEFETLIQSMAKEGIKQPNSATVFSKEEALAVAKKIGYPLMLRPSYVLGGRGMRIVFDQAGLQNFIDEALNVSDSHPVLLDQYLNSAVEVDVDAISDGKSVLIAGITEHIEEAGIHSGDSACSLPPFTLSNEILSRLREQTRLLAKKLKTIGLINIQFAVKNGEIFILEVNPRASRTVPFIAKATGYSIAKIATKVMLGQSLEEQGFTKDFDLMLSTFNVKMPVFPFRKFANTDVLLGPEMKSTGEVMGRASTFDIAYAKALIASKIQIPQKGCVFLSICDRDKNAIQEIALKLLDLGFTLEATPGTHEFLKAASIPSTKVLKMSEGSPHCLDQILKGKYSFVINTSQDEKGLLDGYSIRRTTLEKQLPYCTLITTARAFLRAIAAVRKGTFELHPL